MSQVKNNFCTCCATPLTDKNKPFTEATFCLNCGDDAIDAQIAAGELEAYDSYVEMTENTGNTDCLADRGIELFSFENN